MQPETRPKVALPKSIRLEEDGQRTTLTWRWLRWQHGLLAFILAFSNGILLFVLLDSPISTQGKPLSSLLTTLLLYMAGPLLLSYWTLAGLLNTTRLEVSRGELRIQHGPLPWPGNRMVPGGELTQLYGREVRTSKGGVSYSLLALDRQGREMKLLSGLEHEDQVLYLEQTLERLLGIEDSYVEGELAQRNQVA